MNFFFTLHSVLTGGSVRGSTSVKIPTIVIEESSGKAGRPRKTINPTFLKDALDPGKNITLATIAKVAGVNRKVLRREMKRQDLHRAFSSISDDALDAVVTSYKEEKQHSTGRGYVGGHLRQKGLHIQRARLIDSIKRVDPLGEALRSETTKRLDRQTYQVSQPNALWHMDGHHKLIAWGFVIHGCVDGFSRTVSDLNLLSVLYSDSFLVSTR